MVKDSCILEKSHIIATILNSKTKYMGQDFVTLRECNQIIEELNFKFKELNLKVEITDSINEKIFKIFDGIVVIDREEITISDIKKQYIKNIASIDVLDIVWDDKLIYDLLCLINSKEESLDFKPADLAHIIEKIVENSKEFYEKIASELEQEEYNYLKNQVNNSCISCELACGDREKRECPNWKNDALIGKMKVKSKLSCK